MDSIMERIYDFFYYDVRNRAAIITPDGDRILPEIELSEYDTVVTFSYPFVNGFGQYLLEGIQNSIIRTIPPKEFVDIFQISCGSWVIIDDRFEFTVRY